MFGGFGMAELAIILVIVLMVFGAGKIPELGSGVGKAITNFKKSIKDDEKKNLIGDKGQSEV
ncbi:MAG: twin-arginine translocase TatA/TatE family subunit [Proteobacteria bacterium]|nr:twin-arginine translocase TatA/TatE family subunit [Pseudomonadota bacterium]